MATIHSQAILVLIASCMLTVSSANRGWFWGFNCTWPFKHGQRRPLPPPPPPPSQSPRKIIVGGSEHWHFGFDYNDWALKNGPFYLNDTLVFKYDPPNRTSPHSVYLLPDMWSFFNCDLKRAKRVANSTQGGGDGFEFVLQKWKPHYFACGEGDGFHCRNGTMKFFVMPAVHAWF